MSFRFRFTPYERLGFEFAWGAIICIGMFILLALPVAFLMPTDDCDKDHFHRCGLQVVTDNKTGKQYLVSPHGGIIERGVKP